MATNEPTLNLDFAKLLDPQADEIEVRQIITDFCHVNLADLNTALARQAGIYAYASAVLEAAAVQESRDKVAKEKAEALALRAERINVRNEDEKFVLGASQINIRLEPGFAAATEKLLESSDKVGRLKALVKGLEHRKDMLVQLSARQRREEDNS